MYASFPVYCSPVGAIRAVGAVKCSTDVAAAARFETEACGKDIYEQLQSKTKRVRLDPEFHLTLIITSDTSALLCLPAPPPLRLGQ